MKAAIHWASRHPKRLIMLDAMGAVISAVALYIAVFQLESFFGIPRIVFGYSLGLAGCIFVLDLSYLLGTGCNNGISLQRIAAGNITYCLLIVVLAIAHRDALTIYGWLYYTIELFILVWLASLEFRVAKQLTA